MVIFDTYNFDLSLFGPYARIWIENTDPDFFYYRLYSKEQHVFDPYEQVAVFNKPREEQNIKQQMYNNGLWQFNLCQKGQSAVELKISSRVSVVGIKFEQSPWLVLPRRERLSLPPHNPWGCKIKVALLPYSKDTIFY